MSKEPVLLKAVEREPDRLTVQILERYLEAAKTGELRGVFIVAIKVGGGIRRCWGGDYEYGDVIQACEQVKFDLMMEARDQSTYTAIEDEPEKTDD